MIKYFVLENDRPAEYPLTEAWNNCRFDSFKEAETYARDWLNDWQPVSQLTPEDWEKGYNYSLYDVVRIVKIHVSD